LFNGSEAGSGVGSVVGAEAGSEVGSVIGFEAGSEVGSRLDLILGQRLGHGLGKGGVRVGCVFVCVVWGRGGWGGLGRR
jgi:hypothetical protein